MNKLAQEYNQTPPLAPIIPVEYRALIDMINLATGFRAGGMISAESKIIDAMQSFMYVIEEENKKLTQAIENEQPDQDESEAN